MSSKAWKKAYSKAYKLWKEVCIKRDGRICQVEKHFGHYEGLLHSETIQVDHCFGRGNHWLHLDPDNGTVVCSACNFSKMTGRTPAAYLIYEIVKHRVGQDKFSDMLTLFTSKRPNINWKRADWMEDQAIKLEKMLNEKKEEAEQG